MIRQFRKMCILFCVYLFATAQAQTRPADGRPGGADAPKVTITGKVFDASTGKPLEYATVILFAKRDGRQVTGIVTAPDGTFELKDLFPGQFRMTINYMGYHARTLEDVSPKRGSVSHDVGTIRLKPAVLPGEGVEIQADRPEFEYKIDRRVINVGQQQTAMAGTAVEVLENVPSITVDADNNVQLRGSSNFTVLIDNRPTPLDANTALQQTPASIIEQIEIITNPSAKYDPDGTAGIINLKLKKEKQSGGSGIFNANLGLNDIAGRSGGDMLLSRRGSKTNVYFGLDYNRRSRNNTSRIQQTTFLGDTTLFRNSRGDNERGGGNFGVRAGMDYSATSRDLLSIGMRIGRHSFDGDSENRYDEWREPGGVHELYRSLDKNSHSGDFYSLNLGYKHDFAKTGHELQAEAILGGHDGDDEDTNRLFDASGGIAEAQRATESGPSRDLRLKLDYTLPLRAEEKIQAGVQTRISSGEEQTERFIYDPGSGVYEFQQPYSHTIDASHTIHSLYSTYSNAYGKLGAQAGVRGEYTGRDIRLEDTGDDFTIDRWDVFPTAHLSYTFAEGRQAMTSYTRRVQRPRNWDLEPFETWMDAYNVRQGNPELEPEFIDSYEVTFQSTAGQSLFSVEGYYRVTHNKIERIQSLYAPRITLHTMDNVGQDYSLGSEIMLNVNPVKPWNVNLMGSLYQYRVEGELLGNAFSRESFNWNVRFNNTFRITSGTRLQANLRYNSPSVSSQGRREGHFVSGFSLRQEFLNRSLSATLQVRDVFRTGTFEFKTDAPGFSTHARITREAPIYMLTLTYNYHNFKRDLLRENGERNGNGDGEAQEGVYDTGGEF
ncbi:TonB-dependent receptor [bacterium]|nr:TonB-dependent receptor [bacterium]